MIYADSTYAPSTHSKKHRRRLSFMLIVVVLVVGTTGAVEILRLPASPAPTAFDNLLIAHRGAGTCAPENTLFAIDRAKALGADAVEVDVLLSKDGIPVVIHDPTLERTTNATGTVAAYTMDQLQAFNAAHGWSMHPYSSIPTLAEVIERTQEQGLILEIELKTDAHSVEQLSRSVADLFAAYDLYETAFVSSFDPRMTYLVRYYDPRIVTAHAVKENATGNPITDAVLTSAWLPRFLGVGLIEPEHAMATDAQLAAWRAAGYAVNVWTIDRAEELSHWMSRAVSITTDAFPKACSATTAG